MKAKIKQSKYKLLWVCLFFVFVGLVILTCLAPKTVAAADRYRFSTPEIQKSADDEWMMKVELAQVDTILGIMGWMNQRKSYIMVSYDSSTQHRSYSFNTPNCAQLCYNYLVSLNTGGWFGSMYNREQIQTVSQAEQQTAEEKYTYEIPTPLYVGEYPATLLNTEEINGGFFGIGNAATVFLHAVGIGKVSHWLASLFGAASPLDTVTLDYGNIKHIQFGTEDYMNQDDMALSKFKPWLEENWEKVKNSIVGSISTIFTGTAIKINDKNIFDDDVIVPKGKTVGPGADQMSGEEVLNAIILKAGDSAPQVLTMLVEIGTNVLGGWCEPPYDYVLRHMPYDLNNMSNTSQEYMDYVTDPRVEMFSGYEGVLGVFGVFSKNFNHNINCFLWLQPTKSLCEAAGNLNAMCDLNFFQDNGLDIFVGWKGTIGHFIICCLALLAIIFLLKGLLQLLMKKGGRGSTGSVVGRTIAIVFLLFLTIGFLAAPEQTGKAVSDVTGKVMSLGSVALDMNDQFNELHTANATTAEKSKLRYWAAYFNVWSDYALGHSLGSNGNVFNSNENTNEYANGYGTSPAKLAGGDTIDLWNVALLEELSDNDIANANRTIDHFLAPRITPTGDITFTVASNPNFEGLYPYSVPPIGGLCIAMALFLVTLMKFLCFLELAIDIALLFVRIITGAFQGSAKIKEELKDLLQDFVRIFSYEVMITLIVYLSFVSTGANKLFFGVVILGGVIGFIWWLLMSPNGTKSVLRPAMFKLFHKVVKRTQMMAKKGISDAKIAIKAATGNYAGAAKEAGERLKLEKEDQDEKQKAKDAKRNKNGGKTMDDGSESDDRRSNTKTAEENGAVRDPSGGKSKYGNDPAEHGDDDRLSSTVPLNKKQSKGNTMGPNHGRKSGGNQFNIKNKSGKSNIKIPKIPGRK